MVKFKISPTISWGFWVKSGNVLKTYIKYTQNV